MEKALKIKIAILLAALNCFAFGVNHYGLTPKIKAITANTSFEIFLFTDIQTDINPSLHQVGEFVQDRDGFWPFESFYVNTSESSTEYTGRFRGFFTGYTGLEFMFYNLMILGILVFLRFW